MALSTLGVHNPEELAEDAWRYVLGHEEFLLYKDREVLGLPKTEE